MGKIATALMVAGVLVISTPSFAAATSNSNKDKSKKCKNSTIQLGEQCWAKTNLNVGTMVNGSTPQTNNNIVEKHCYDNDPNNCLIYGGLYQWDEMMKYSTTESVQGICPQNFHIPSDNEWKTLEIYLGMTQEQADSLGNRGTDQGTQMLAGGSTGLDFPIAGYSTEGAFYGINFRTWLWTSTEIAPDWAFSRGPQVSQVERDWEHKIVGLPVRCVQD